MSSSVIMLSMCSDEWSSTSSRMTVFHVRPPLPSSANDIFHTNRALERGLTEQGQLCKLPTAWILTKKDIQGKVPDTCHSRSPEEIKKNRNAVLPTLVTTKRYSTKFESFRYQHWRSLPRLLLLVAGMCTQLWADVNVGTTTISHTGRCKYFRIRVAAWLSKVVSPSPTSTSECNWHCLLRLLLRESRRDTASTADSLSVMDRPALSDFDTASKTHLASMRRAPGVAAICWSCLRKSTEPCSSSYHNNWTYSISSCPWLAPCVSSLLDLRAPLEHFLLCHEMGLHGAE